MIENYDYDCAPDLWLAGKSDSKARKLINNYFYLSFSHCRIKGSPQIIDLKL